MPAVGWTRIALAVRSALMDDRVTALQIDIAGLGAILLDLRARTVIAHPILLSLPDQIVVTGMRALRGGVPLNGLAALAPLDTFLWRVGQVAFPGEAAWWRGPRERMRLIRWPDLAALGGTAEHVRMAAALGNAALTATELARAARVAPDAAERMLTTCALLGLLQEEPADAIISPLHAAERPGLFRRLRERLGA